MKASDYTALRRGGKEGARVCHPASPASSSAILIENTKISLAIEREATPTALIKDGYCNHQSVMKLHKLCQTHQMICKVYRKLLRVHQGVGRRGGVWTQLSSSHRMAKCQRARIMSVYNCGPHLRIGPAPRTGSENTC